MTLIDFSIIILFAHFIADFVFQYDEVAKNKSKSLLVLTRHIFEYTTVLMIVTFFFVLPVDSFVLSSSFLLWLAVNAVFHWITDFFSSRAATVAYTQGRRHDFFVIIGFDQFVHATCLLYTFQWLY